MNMNEPRATEYTFEIAAIENQVMRTLKPNTAAVLPHITNTIDVAMTPDGYVLRLADAANGVHYIAGPMRVQPSQAVLCAVLCAHAPFN